MRRREGPTLIDERRVAKAYRRTEIAKRHKLRIYAWDRQIVRAWTERPEGWEALIEEALAERDRLFVNPGKGPKAGFGKRPPFGGSSELPGDSQTGEDHQEPGWK